MRGGGNSVLNHLPLPRPEVSTVDVKTLRSTTYCYEEIAVPKGTSWWVSNKFLCARVVELNRPWRVRTTESSLVLPRQNYLATSFVERAQGLGEGDEGDHIKADLKSSTPDASDAACFVATVWWCSYHV